MCSPRDGPSLVSRAKALLAQPDHHNAATLVSQIYQRSNPKDRDSANALYRFCAKNFPNCLTLMLLKVYKFSADDSDIRFQSLTLLVTHLGHLFDARVQLCSEAFHDIKKLLVSCLAEQETSDANFKILTKITAFVSFDVFLSETPWEELSGYINSLADKDLGKAMYVFSSMPTVLDEEFLMQIAKKLLPLILKCLSSRDTGAEEWISALEAGFLIGVQLVNTCRNDLGGHIAYAILSSSCELVRNGEEETVRNGLWKLKQKVDDEAERFRSREYRFTTDLVLKMENMRGIDEDTKSAARTVHHILQQKCWES